jgi:hypothetical protein
VTCDTLYSDDGKAIGIVCSRGRRRPPCSECGRLATLLCDWKFTGRKAGKTCDAKLCAKCASEPAAGKHLCPPHARRWAQDPRNPARMVPNSPADNHVTAERINALPKDERLAIARELLDKLRSGTT